MTPPHVEYLGFTTKGDAREYTLRLKPPAGEVRDFVVAIASEAFVARRVRYQDGPDICFLKLQRELAVSGDVMPPPYLSITDAELEEYKLAHAPKAPTRRPRPPPT
jgi:hypothetical protein